MDLDKYISSGFFTKEDFPEPKRFVISEFAEQVYDDEVKPKIKFEGNDKWLVLNQTNVLFLKRHFGTSSSSALIGCHVVLFNDLGVSFRGQIGGLRLRAPDPTPTEQYRQATRDPGDESERESLTTPDFDNAGF